MSALTSTAMIRPVVETGRPIKRHGAPRTLVLMWVAVMVAFIVTPARSAVFRSNTWPGGVVPFEFDSVLNQSQRNVAQAAMNEWMTVANITFRPRETFDMAWVHFRPSPLPIPGANYVGTIGLDGLGYAPGERSVNISDWDRGTLLHELAHILGFVHEQNRVDRDGFIRVEWDNIDSPLIEFNFWEDPLSLTYGGYDFDSIMQYNACALSRCGNACNWGDENCRTITVLPPNQAKQESIGTTSSPSAMDRLVMSFLYPRSDWRFANPGTTQGGTGTFLAPFSPLALAMNDVPEGGTIWLLRPGDYPLQGTISKRMTLRSPLGGAVIGR